MNKVRDRWIRRAFSPGEDDARSMWDNEQWAEEGEKIDPDDRLWKQYVVMVDLYKYYLDTTWKAAVGYYAATGIPLAYYMDRIRTGPKHTLPLLLIFLAAISLGFAYVQWRGARNLSSLTQFLEYIALALRIPGRPHVEFAVVFLFLNAIMLVAVAVGCLILLSFSYR